jgi:hypothetical protein
VFSIELLGIAKISIKNTLIEMAKIKMPTMENSVKTKLCLRNQTKNERSDRNKTQIKKTSNAPKASQ